MSFPTSEFHSISASYYSDHRYSLVVSIFDQSPCKECGVVRGVVDSRLYSSYQPLRESDKKWLEKWKEFFEKENKNDRGND